MKISRKNEGKLNLVRNKVKTKTKREMLAVGTLNVRTLKSNHDLLELENALKDSNLNILGLSEVRRKAEANITTRSNNILYHSTSTNGQRGVGFIVKPELRNKVVELSCISDRIAKMVVKLEEDKTCTIVQVYSPTASAADDEIESFYSEIQSIITQCIQENKQVIVMGDFNSQIGMQLQEESRHVGNFGYGKRNERGWRLLSFCQENNMKIVNTFFLKTNVSTVDMDLTKLQHEKLNRLYISASRI